jgi:hypothetical protein
MLGDDHLLRAMPISSEANKLIRDILRFHPELRLSVPEISVRVLQLRSFFDSPRIKSTSAGLRKMMFIHQRMLARSDPVARRRKELEYLRVLDETSAFNDLSGRLPLPPPPPKIRVTNPLGNHLPRANRPYCAPIQGIPVSEMKPSHEELTRVRNKWWYMDNLKLAGGWYYP